MQNPFNKKVKDLQNKPRLQDDQAKMSYKPNNHDRESKIIPTLKSGVKEYCEKKSYSDFSKIKTYIETDLNGYLTQAMPNSENLKKDPSGYKPGLGLGMEKNKFS